MDPTCTTNLHFGDGFVMIEPNVPPDLPKKLRYWHRQLKWDEEQMRRVSTGTYENLSTISATINPATGEYQQRLITLPGFAFKCKSYLKELGWTVNYIDKRTPMPKPNYDKAIEGLRPYQVEVLCKAIASGGGIISAPTGWGKGRLLKGIVAAFSHEELLARNTPLAVIAGPDKDIMRKNYDEMVELLPDREVGLLMSGSNKRSDDVQVITLDSLHLINPMEVGVFICDEVHSAASETRSEQIVGMKLAAKWGVSATPDGRFDGRDLVTEGLFGPVVSESTYQDAVRVGALVPIKVYWMKCPEPPDGIEKHLRYKTRNGRYGYGVFRNAARNKIIGDILRRTPKEHQTLVIMQYLDHMNRIMAHCPTDTAIVHAETSKDKIAKDGLTNLRAISTSERRDIYQKMAREEIHQILSTYVYKQGVNFPNLEVVIQAGGGGSDIVAKQIPGRESRKTADKEVSYLVDFWHPWDTTDKNDRVVPGPIHADDRAREKAYTHLGFDQVWVDNIDQLPFTTQNQ